MFLSVFELYKIGIGPSSSHTVGPMVAARRFMTETVFSQSASQIKVRFYGSLAFTGKGHATGRACVLGLAGESPDTVDLDHIDEILHRIHRDKTVYAVTGQKLHFDPETDLVFDKLSPPLKGHANGMVISVYDPQDILLHSETYYSIGGGFIQTAEEFSQATSAQPTLQKITVPYPFATAKEMLAMGKKSNLTIAEMRRANELTQMLPDELEAGLDRIWLVMNACMVRGLNTEGHLPGGLNVKRRAAEIYATLKQERTSNSLQPHRIMDFLSVYAMAINEENAAGGRVVTAPTNGAAGVVPAVIRYYLDHCLSPDKHGVHNFLLTSSAIGSIIKHNASISGAEVGCQGEVGSASAMAAAGLCAALGGSNEQIENAAEIALEHHLGMTCDPVAGLVQVPCIERNAFGAVKAVNAASLALRGDGSHFIPLDTCIETMRQTGLDMSIHYKETSTGGLAVNVVEC